MIKIICISEIINVPLLHVRKLPVTWGQAVVFAGYSGFLHYLQLASHELATIGINVTKNKIQIQIKPIFYYSRFNNP